SYSTAFNIALTVAAPGVLGNDNDPDGDTLTAAVTTGPTHGSLTLNADGSFTYTPNATFSGTDSFRYTANDGHGNGATATATIAVAAPPGTDLGVAITHSPDPVPTNGTVTFTITVTNNGLSAAPAAVDTTSLSGSTFGSVQSSAGTCTLSKGKT